MPMPPRSAVLGRTAPLPQRGAAPERWLARVVVVLIGTLVGLGMASPSALADPSESQPGDGPIAAGHERDAIALIAALNDSIAIVDQAIRSVSGATDRVASMALTGRIGALANHQDRRMNDRTDSLFSNAAMPARSDFELATTVPPTRGVISVYAPVRAAEVRAPRRLGPAASRRVDVPARRAD